MKDIIGKALLDFYHGNYTEDIRTETNISEEDLMPLPYLLRRFDEMPKVEQKALKLAKGKILDVGCAAGIHSLFLQNNGLDVKAIDISPGAIEVCKLQGIKNVEQIDLLDLKNEQFDTILILMNGTGIFKNLNSISFYLEHLKTLLSPSGQILIDSSDLIYMYDSEELEFLEQIGSYYGEIEFIMKYKNEESDPFDWLYLDEKTFEKICHLHDLDFEVVERGENFDYLARLSCRY